MAKDAAQVQNGASPPQIPPNGKIVADRVSLEPLSCVICRARKLKCDRMKPACGRCVRVSVDCVYPGSRRKPKVRRRNVSQLEERLAQLEELLQGGRQLSGGPAGGISGAASEGSPGAPLGASLGASSGSLLGAPSGTSSSVAEPVAAEEGSATTVFFDHQQGRGAQGTTEEYSIGLDNVAAEPQWAHVSPGLSPRPTATAYGPLSAMSQPGGPSRPDPGMDISMDLGAGALVRLGMTEPLPPPEMIVDLHDEFFQRNYAYIPILHPGRYLNKFYSPPHMRPPMCLQYIIWALAAYGHEKYDMYHDAFYRRARAYIDIDEMKGVGEHFITLDHAQALCLLSTYQSRLRLYTRASMDLARGMRLITMMGLHCLDGDKGPMLPSLMPPASWVELEERRRTFWSAFCGDSHCSIATGWPSLIDPNEITTHLPSPEESFMQGTKEKTTTLQNAIDTNFAGVKYTWFTGLVFICHIHSQLLKHTYRPTPQDNPANVEHGAYWRRHRSLDSQLKTIFSFLPEKMAIPQNNAPSAFHTAMNLHTAVIILHHAALAKIDEHHLPDALRAESRQRLHAAAESIAGIVRATSHLIQKKMKAKAPLLSLAHYLGSTAYMSLALESPSKSLSPGDHDNLVLLINAMLANAASHQVAESFLYQLIMDIEHSGLARHLNLPDFSAFQPPPSMQNNCSIPLVARNNVTKFRNLMTLVQSMLGMAHSPMSKTDTGQGPSQDQDSQASKSPLSKYPYVHEEGAFARLSAQEGTFARNSASEGAFSRSSVSEEAIFSRASSTEKRHHGAPTAPTTPMELKTTVDCPPSGPDAPNGPRVPWLQNPNAMQIATVDPFMPAITLPDRTGPAYPVTAAQNGTSIARPGSTKFVVGLGGLDVDMSMPVYESSQQRHQQSPPVPHMDYADWGEMLNMASIFGPQHMGQQTMGAFAAPGAQQGDGPLSWGGWRI